MFPIIAGAFLLIVTGVSLVAQAVGVRQTVVSFGTAGLRALEVARARAASRDMDGAADAFTTAADQFGKAENAFASLNPAVDDVLQHTPGFGATLSSGKHLVTAAQAISRAAAAFSRVAGPLSRGGQGFQNVADVIANLEQDETTLNAITADVGLAIDELDQVNAKRLPRAYQSQVADIQQALPGLRQAVGSLAKGTDVAASFMGVGQPVEFLFAFQNVNELRPSGGFLGSFALIRLDHGEFKILDAPPTGSYGVDQQLPNTIKPPLPLQVVTSSWYFHDANWYPDFPTTAEQLVRFYQLARGFRPDGVVAVTNTFLERLLMVTGPIDMPAYRVTVNASNVTAIAQEQTEVKYDLRTNDPKRFIADLIPMVANTLAELPVDRYPTLLATMVASFATGDIQLWSESDPVEQSLADLNWSGAMPSNTSDVLGLIDANIGGGKTDGVITTSMVDRLNIQSDGSVIADVEVTQEHHGLPSDPFTGSRNRTYHRLYVPLGSKLLAAEGFTTMPTSVFQRLPSGSEADGLLARTEGRVTVDELSGTRINDEFGKTVFGNWTELSPGKRVTFSFTYQLPFRVGSDLETYSLLLLRQAGAKQRHFTLEVKAPLGTTVTSADGKTVAPLYSADILTTRTLSFILKKER